MSNVTQINGYKITAESASFAATASLLLGSVVSASYAATASLLLGSVVSASYAATSSLAVNATNAGYATSAGNASNATNAVFSNTSSLALGISSSVATSDTYSIALVSPNVAPTLHVGSGLTFDRPTQTLSATRISVGQISATGITGSFSGSIATATTAATASYVNTLNQNVTVNGNLTVNGTASYTYTTASSLNVGSNTISVNTATPAVRFGGISVYDSGSTGATGSLFWDSLNNGWVYQQASGSTYSGGALMSGPRNTGSLGSEQFLTKWFIARSDGYDHLNDTQIYSSASIHVVTGSLTVTAGVTGSLLGTASYVTTAETASYSSTLGATIGQNAAGTFQLKNSAGTVISSLNVNTITSSLAYTASYISPTFISASAAASGFGSGGGTSTPAFPYTGSAQITGSLGVTGSLKVTGGITGSLLGTAANATLAASADSIYIPTNSTPGTYSIPVYPAGGEDGNNVLRSSGLAYDFNSGHLSLSVVSSSITNAVGFVGTASYATRALTASYALTSAGGGLSGGTANYIPLWTGASALSSSVIIQDPSNGTIQIGDDVQITGSLIVTNGVQGVQGIATALAQGNFLFSGL